MVRAPQVASVVPPAAERQGARHDLERPLHQPRLLSGAPLQQAIRERARALGFDAIGFAGADGLAEAGPRLRDWLANGYHAGMEWMAERPERRVTPGGLWSDVRGIVMLGINYGGGDPLANLSNPDIGTISLYARRRDYHEIIKGRLKELAGLIAVRGGSDVKVFVDTAPVLEKALAVAAGLGWQGKNTVLTSRTYGSWLFLGAIYTTVAFNPDTREPDHCGTCRKCLDICPTKAFPQPYVLDSARCIAYLTVEHKGHIPRAFRKAIGNRVFGCDDCLAVCPWNKFAQEAREAKLALRPELEAPRLDQLAGLDDTAFRALFAGTPVKRLGHIRFIRNVLIALGNSGLPRNIPHVLRWLEDPSALVRAAAVWAAGELMQRDDLTALVDRHAAAETDSDVAGEWRHLGKRLSCA